MSNLCKRCRTTAKVLSFDHNNPYPRWFVAARDNVTLVNGDLVHVQHGTDNATQWVGEVIVDVNHWKNEYVVMRVGNIF